MYFKYECTNNIIKMESYTYMSDSKSFLTAYI